MGYCAVPVDGIEAQFVSGAFYGRGGGRGRRNCFYATGRPGWMRAQRGMRAFGSIGPAMPEIDEAEALRSQADLLKGQLEAVEARITAIEEAQGPGKE